MPRRDIRTRPTSATLVSQLAANLCVSLSQNNKQQNKTKQAIHLYHLLCQVSANQRREAVCAKSTATSWQTQHRHPRVLRSSQYSTWLSCYLRAGSIHRWLSCSPYSTVWKDIMLLAYNIHNQLTIRRVLFKLTLPLPPKNFSIQLSLRIF